MIKPIKFNNKLKRKNKKYYQCNYKNEKDIKLKEKYMYVYSVDGIYTRKTYMSDYIVYETINDIKENEIDGNKIIRNKNLPIQLQKSLNYKFYNDIYFIGRYAQWYHGIKLNEIIKRVKKLCVN
ncbi:MAG: hypothetical protein ISS28_01175 [Candidatus Cloacimonetes bacterium]|nr:hypothetical protein [Actinomycetota bacterium]MBL7085700.1 hypothetical protein [Candidatus Cloacimonadota bacterium]